MAVPWGLNLGPWCKNVILTGARKSYLKVVYAFFTHQTFPIFIPLAVPWCPNLDPCSESLILTGAPKIRVKVVSVFYPSGIFHVRSFVCPLGSQLGSLRQKSDPDRCVQKIT